MTAAALAAQFYRPLPGAKTAPRNNAGIKQFVTGHCLLPLAPSSHVLLGALKTAKEEAVAENMKMSRTLIVMVKKIRDIVMQKSMEEMACMRFAWLGYQPPLYSAT